MMGVRSAVNLVSVENNIDIRGGGIDKGVKADDCSIVDEEVAVWGDSLKYGEYAMS